MKTTRMAVVALLVGLLVVPALGIGAATAQEVYDTPYETPEAIELARCIYYQYRIGGYEVQVGQVSVEVGVISDGSGRICPW